MNQNITKHEDSENTHGNIDRLVEAEMLFEHKDDASAENDLVLSDCVPRLHKMSCMKRVASLQHCHIPNAHIGVISTTSYMSRDPLFWQQCAFHECHVGVSWCLANQMTANESFKPMNRRILHVF